MTRTKSAGGQERPKASTSTSAALSTSRVVASESACGTRSTQVIAFMAIRYAMAPKVIAAAAGMLMASPARSSPTWIPAAVAVIPTTRGKWRYAHTVAADWPLRVPSSAA